MNGLLVFEPCQKTSCTNITILQDGCILEREKQFMLLLNVDRNNIDGILIDIPAGSVVITDDDGRLNLFSVT